MIYNEEFCGVYMIEKTNLKQKCEIMIINSNLVEEDSLHTIERVSNNYMRQNKDTSSTFFKL